MATIQILFDDKNLDVAAALGRALVEISGGAAMAPAAAAKPEAVEDAPEVLDYKDAGQEADAEPASGNVLVDKNGVPHNPELCGSASAKAPLYGTGKMAGQWKRRVKVDENAYNAWYAGELAKIQGAASEGAASEGAKPPATAEEAKQAFQQLNQGADDSGGDSVSLTGPAPKNLGELTAFVAENQAVGLLQGEDLGVAYTKSGVTIQALTTASEELQGELCRRVFVALQPIIAARKVMGS